MRKGGGRGVEGAASSALARGIRWRLMGSLLVVITAAIAVGTAIVGPLFLRAGGDSLVRQAVAGASLSKTSFGLTPSTHATTMDRLASEQDSLLATGHLTGLYASSVVKTVVSTVLVTSENNEVYRGPTDLPHRHLLGSPLQRRRVSSGAPRCSPQRTIEHAPPSLRRVDDHRQRPQARRSCPDPHHRRVPAPEPAERLLVRRSGATTSPSGRTPKSRLNSTRLTICSWRAPPPSRSRLLTCAQLTIQRALRPGALGIGNASAVRRDMLALKQRAAHRRVPRSKPVFRRCSPVLSISRA